MRTTVDSLRGTGKMCPGSSGNLTTLIGDTTTILETYLQLMIEQPRNKLPMGSFMICSMQNLQEPLSNCRKLYLLCLAILSTGISIVCLILLKALH